MLTTKLILEISLPFLGVQVTLYQILFDKFFLQRFKIFNDAVKRYIRDDIDVLIKELQKQNKKKSNTNSIIDTINERSLNLSELNDLRKKRDNITEIAKYSYLLFGSSSLFGLLASGLLIERPFLFNLTISTFESVDSLDILFIFSVLFLIYLGYKLLDLNYLLTKYETEGSLSRIIEQIREENED